MTAPERPAVDFAGLLLGTLGHTDDEFTSLFYKDDAGIAHTAVYPAADAAAAAALLPATSNVYFGVNPVTGPARKNAGRGTEADVTRLAALWADLDVGPGKCASVDIARAVIAEVTIALGTRPSVIVDTGHGLHPYWPIDGGRIGDDFPTTAARALLRRFARLVAAIAARHGATVDNVYDLARSLRIPGSFNNKYAGNGAEPLPVRAYADIGGPLTIAEADERLAEVGVTEEPGDTDSAAAVICPPGQWCFADQTCPYVAAILEHLPADGPPANPKPGKGTGRHQWAASVAVKLTCAHRAGCLSEPDARRAVDMLGARLTALRDATGDPTPRHEVRQLFAYAAERVAAKTDDECTAELGGHTHAGATDWVDRLATSPTPPNLAGEVPAEPVDADENYIRDQLKILRLKREARRRLDAEENPPADPPAAITLPALLAEPAEATRYRIADVLPYHGRAVLSSRRKAGKSTVVGNLLRSLADGDPFLGTFAVNATARAIVLIDTELPRNTLRAWLGDQNIANGAAVADVIALRGKLSAFDILDPRRRAQWAARLAAYQCDYLILDCLRPVLDALGLDENHDAGRFLVQFEAMLDAAGVNDAAVVQHMGHAGERARGDSRIEDYPDALLRIVTETDDLDSPRFFSAYGRDVAIAEGRLAFDPTTRHLTYVAGSRTDAKIEAALPAVIQIVADAAEPISQRGVEKESDYPRAVTRAALALAVGRQLIAQDDGPNRSKLHRIRYPCSGCRLPVASRRDRHESCPPTAEGSLF